MPRKSKGIKMSGISLVQQFKDFDMRNTNEHEDIKAKIDKMSDKLDEALLALNTHEEKLKATEKALEVETTRRTGFEDGINVKIISALSLAVVALLGVVYSFLNPNK